ncbi:MAG TPA: hypothetical protein VN931_10750 [Fibrobacteria bacterium]|nr:hypothetical protein [Fibrobacteria bacterium]
MKRTIFVLLLGGAAGWFAGCGDTVQSLMGPYQLHVDSTTVSFAQVQPILLEKCAICHSEYNDSAQIVAKGVNQIYTQVYDYSMPASGVAQLAPQDRIDLLRWLQEMKTAGYGGKGG